MARNKIQILAPGRFCAPPAPPPELPTCEAECMPETVKWRKYSKGEGASTICGSSSAIKILGKHYCKKHGGIILLNLAAQGRLIIE